MAWHTELIKQNESSLQTALDALASSNVFYWGTESKNGLGRDNLLLIYDIEEIAKLRDWSLTHHSVVLITRFPTDIEFKCIRALLKSGTRLTLGVSILSAHRLDALLILFANFSSQIFLYCPAVSLLSENHQKLTEFLRTGRNHLSRFLIQTDLQMPYVAHFDPIALPTLKEKCGLSEEAQDKVTQLLGAFGVKQKFDRLPLVNVGNRPTSETQLINRLQGHQKCSLPLRYVKGLTLQDLQALVNIEKALLLPILDVPLHFFRHLWRQQAFKNQKNLETLSQTGSLYFFINNHMFALNNFKQTLVREIQWRASVNGDRIAGFITKYFVRLFWLFLRPAVHVWHQIFVQHINWRVMKNLRLISLRLLALQGLAARAWGHIWWRPIVALQRALGGIKFFWGQLWWRPVVFTQRLSGKILFFWGKFWWRPKVWMIRHAFALKAKSIQLFHASRPHLDRFQRVIFWPLYKLYYFTDYQLQKLRRALSE